MYTRNDHTFAICAYKESPYLEDCILSLISQTIKPNIIMETSTPNDFIISMANKYNIKLFINPDGGLAKDWNYAYDSCDTELVTIAHQDDIYEPNYLESILEYANTTTNPIIFFTDYYEIRNNERVSNNLNLNIKRIMNHPFTKINNRNKIKLRQRILSFGDSISCPTVTLTKKKCGYAPYDLDFKCSADYKTWSRLSNIEGEFIYIPKILMGHRIYRESTTTKSLENNIRQQEDASIMAEYWPKPIAKIIYKIYSNSEKSNNV